MLHKMTILCTGFWKVHYWSFCCVFATKGHTNPYHPIIDISIIANPRQIVNKMLQDFVMKFTFCASRTENCG